MDKTELQFDVFGEKKSLEEIEEAEKILLSNEEIKGSFTSLFFALAEPFQVEFVKIIVLSFYLGAQNERLKKSPKAIIEKGIGLFKKSDKEALQESQKESLED